LMGLGKTKSLEYSMACVKRVREKERVDVVL
jgi:hypothetical protein